MLPAGIFINFTVSFKSYSIQKLKNEKVHPIFYNADSIGQSVNRSEQL